MAVRISKLFLHRYSIRNVRRIVWCVGPIKCGNEGEKSPRLWQATASFELQSMFIHSPVGAKVSIARQLPRPLIGNPKIIIKNEIVEIDLTRIEILVVPLWTVHPWILISGSLGANVNTVQCTVRDCQFANEWVFLIVFTLSSSSLLKQTCELWMEAMVEAIFWHVSTASCHVWVVGITWALIKMILKS